MYKSVYPSLVHIMKCPAVIELLNPSFFVSCDTFLRRDVTLAYLRRTKVTLKIDITKIISCINSNRDMSTYVIFKCTLCESTRTKNMKSKEQIKLIYVFCNVTRTITKF